MKNPKKKKKLSDEKKVPIKIPRKNKDLKDHLISTAVASTRKMEYLDHQLDLLNAHLPYSETESVWFPIKVLEDYIKFLRKLSTAENKIDGVRIHFASYPNRVRIDRNGILKPKNEKYGMTLQLVPTIPNIEQQRKRADPYFRHDDVYIENGEMKRLRESKKEHWKIRNEDIILNEGLKCPPPVESGS